MDIVTQPTLAEKQDTPTIWYGCYDDGWKDITPEAFSHPAKFAQGLVGAIFEYGLEKGYFAPGMVVVDPFGGVGLGAKYALWYGLSWVGCELEKRFTDLGQGCECTGISKADWVGFYGRWDKVAHKDGRHWCPQCLAEAKQVTTDRGQLSFFEPEPSAAYTRNSGIIPETKPHHYTGNLELFKRYAKPGTFAVLLNGDSRRLRAVIGQAQRDGLLSSPPYIQALGHDSGHPRLDEVEDKRRATEGSSRRNGYGNGRGQLSGLPEGNLDSLLSSPPFAGNSGGRGEASRNGIDAALFDRHSGGMKGGTGDDPANLDHLPMRGLSDALVSSPPFENGVPQHDKGFKAPHDSNGNLKGDYGQTTGQLGTEQGTTFWAAARQIVSESYLALKDDSYQFWVTKAFIRDKNRVDFPGQWRQLCEACGFEYVESIYAMQISEAQYQQELNGEAKKIQKATKSFFRRTYEKKFPDNRIDWEEVIVMRKPGGCR